jgi:hypothetical protein
MRALAGSIIAAGAMIGLGLTALGFGVRYQNAPWTEASVNPRTGLAWGATSMWVVLIALLAAAAIGLAVAFIGLAYHHERRHRERLHQEAMGMGGSRLPT